MNLTFFDTHSSWANLLPLTYTKPVSELRIGIFKIHEKWHQSLGEGSTFFRTENYLSPLFPVPKEKTLMIKGNLLPAKELVEQLKKLNENQVIVSENEVIAGYFDANEEIKVENREEIQAEEIDLVERPWDIFRKNGEQIRTDFALISKTKKSQKLTDSHTTTYGTDIFIEEGAKIKAAVLNAETGPIYIGKNAEIQEGSLIRGPFAMCEKAVINMGAKMRSDTTIGPYSKVGGEISNSVIQGYSNKGHEGFLGNSVLGEWCNLGADTNNSNLKNNYSNIKVWDFDQSAYTDTGLQFCGLIMGDHSKCGINTMFNTGTMVGVFANIFGGDFPPKMIPSFSWGGVGRSDTYQLEKAFETAEKVMSRRNKTLTDAHKKILSHIFEATAEERR